MPLLTRRASGAVDGDHEVERAVAVEVAERERADVGGEDVACRAPNVPSPAPRVELGRVGAVAADDEVGVAVAVDVADGERACASAVVNVRRGGRVEAEPGRAGAAAVQVHARGAGVDDDQVEAVVVVDVGQRDRARVLGVVGMRPAARR